MSSLNKAFIKAYDKSRAQAAAAPRPLVPPPRQAAAPQSVPPAPLGRETRAAWADTPRHSAPSAGETGASKTPLDAAEHSVAAQHMQTALQPKPVEEQPVVSVLSSSSPTAAVPVTLFDAAHALPAAPHAKFSERVSAADPPKNESAAPRVDTAPQRPTALKETLEIPPIAASPIILPMPAPSGALQPVFEVTRFNWPPVVEQLLTSAPAQFRAAATDLIDASRRHRKLVAVTAAHRGEGCTAVSLALARALVEQQQHVILVDGHFDSPALCESLGLAAVVGWEDSLSGDTPLAEALVESLEDHLTVLPLRQAAAEDWRVGIARLKSSLDELRRNCDMVLIDAGPLGTPDDRRHLLSWAAPCRLDRALIVRDVRTTTEEEAADLDAQLHRGGIAQWHFVENFAAA